MRGRAGQGRAALQQCPTPISHCLCRSRGPGPTRSSLTATTSGEGGRSLTSKCSWHHPSASVTLGLAPMCLHLGHGCHQCQHLLSATAAPLLDPQPPVITRLGSCRYQPHFNILVSTSWGAPKEFFKVRFTCHWPHQLHRLPAGRKRYCMLGRRCGICRGRGLVMHQRRAMRGEHVRHPTRLFLSLSSNCPSAWLHRASTPARCPLTTVTSCTSGTGPPRS